MCCVDYATRGRRDELQYFKVKHVFLREALLGKRSEDVPNIW